MEGDISSESQGCSSPHENGTAETGSERTHAPDADDFVTDLLHKASIGTGSSDDEEEYLSAEEDENDNDYVIQSVNANSDLPENNECDVKDDSQSECDAEETSEETQDEKEKKIAEELERRKMEEESLTEEEIMDRRKRGQVHKDSGNAAFRNADYDEAESEYTTALDICPLTFYKDRAIMYANRAACKMKKDAVEDAIADSTLAIELHPQYLKAILRRAELYEKSEKLDEACKDYESVVALDPGHHIARAACMRLQEQIKERNEKMKVEMMGKLKDLGNLVLRPFGLSTNNFKLQQDPDSGSYSVQFQQSPTGNGS